jgi:hypothetical protein
MTKSRVQDSAAAARSGWMDQWLDIKAAQRRPDDALMFPGGPGALAFSRHPDAVVKQFMARAAKLGFPGLRFHDLRGTHETLLWIAACRCIRSPRGADTIRPSCCESCQTDQEERSERGGGHREVDQDDPLALYWPFGWQLLARPRVEYA